MIGKETTETLFFVAIVSKETQVIEFGHILTKDQINVAISNAFCKFESNTKKQHHLSRRRDDLVIWKI